MPFNATMTSRGQIATPRDISGIFDSNIMVIDVKDGKVMLRPVKSMAGVLAKYREGTEPPPYENREKVFQAAARNRTRETDLLPERVNP